MEHWPRNLVVAGSSPVPKSAPVFLLFYCLLWTNCVTMLSTLMLIKLQTCTGYTKHQGLILQCRTPSRQYCSYIQVAIDHNIALAASYVYVVTLQAAGFSLQRPAV